MMETLERKIERLEAENKQLLNILRKLRGDLSDMQRNIAGDIGELLDSRWKE